MSKRLNLLISNLKSFGHKEELEYLIKLSAKSDKNYDDLLEEVFREFLSSNVSAYYDPANDPIIGPTRQVTCIDFLEDMDHFDFKIVPDQVCVGIVRPLSNQLLSSYGLTSRQIIDIRNKYPHSFYWEKSKAGDAFDVTSYSAGMDIYPTLSQFSKIEAILPRIVAMNLSWFQVVLKVDPTIKITFNHEMTHLINSMRGSKLPTQQMSEEDSLNSPEEIQATYIEIFKQIKEMFELKNENIIQMLLSNNHQAFMESIFQRYHHDLGVGIISEEVRDKYISKFSKLFSELREKALKDAGKKDRSGFSQWNSKNK
jgi:hypothetical protein